MGQKTSKQDDLVHAFKQAKANIVIIGVKKSGMTSILQKLIPNNPNFGGSMMGNAATTMTPYKGVNLTMWGIGFGLKRPPLWNYHLKKAEELLLIVDSGNRRTLVAMKEELDEIFDQYRMETNYTTEAFLLHLGST
uniref:ADP-ribosylation factor 3-like n=1 Tax=Styela clava TaxID=7725 RepID=UPI00193ADA89|nr:ADP-ribosylation factor 3-like [Styela clava]